MLHKSTTVYEVCTDLNCPDCRCTGCGDVDQTELTVWGDEQLCKECLNETFMVFEQAAAQITPSWAV